MGPVGVDTQSPTGSSLDTRTRRLPGSVFVWGYAGVGTYVCGLEPCVDRGPQAHYPYVGGLPQEGPVPVEEE